MAPKRASVVQSESSTPSNAQTLDLAAPSGCSFFGKTLILNNVRVHFIHYENGDVDEIWMPAKPIMKTTGEANITQIMDRVFPDDKLTFEELVNTKGLPLEGCYGFVTPPNPEDYNEKKAIWVNESGFYAMALGSRKPHCVEFQRWVLHAVLPSLRRTGQYSIGQSSHAQKAWEKSTAVLVKRMDRNGSRGVLAVRKSHLKQQKTIRRMQTAFEGRVALLEKTLDAAMGRQEERLLSKLSAQCEQISMRALLYGQRIFRSLFGDLKGSFRQSFVEVVDEARASGVIELTRHAGTSAAHQADQALLLERGRKLPSGAEGIALFQEVGDLLPVSTYLEGRLEPEQQSVISHFTPPFSRELKKRKLLEAVRMQERPWIAWCQGAWRIQYTERDREMMDALYDEAFWKQKMEKMLVLHAGGHGPRRQPHASADRGGAHAAPREPAAQHVTPRIWRSLFHSSSSR
jgi:prophage antirepressor-like protein